MNKISLVMPYYRNGGMLAKHYKLWAAYPAAMRASLDVVIVDDGSPENAAADVPRPAGLPRLSIYRIGVDIRWNQDAARNIGVHHARHGWVLMTDMDHMVPEATMRAVMSDGLDPKTVYKFSRVSAPDLAPYKPHPNSWLLTRKMFDRIGGYDEALAGYYGTDADFKKRVEKRAGVVIRKDILIRVPRDVIADASTTTYLRKQPEDKEGLFKLISARPRHWQPKRLSFPYERVA